jgi:predicted MFS family arabinose efflux permease
MIGQALGWRWAFYLLGFPGILFALLVWQVREPARGTQDRSATEPPRGPAPVDTPQGLLAGLREIFRQRTIQLLLLGYSFFSMASSALGLWIPSFLDKNFKVPLAVAGRYAGLCAALGGLLGVICGGVGADWFRRRSLGGRLRFTALCALLCAPLWLILLRAESVAGVLVPFALLMGLGLMWLGPAAADMQDLVGPGQRGLGIGVYFFVVNVIASGLGQPLIGALSDRLGVGADPSRMRVSLLVCPAAALLAAILLGLASISRVRGAERVLPDPRG